MEDKRTLRSLFELFELYESQSKGGDPYLLMDEFKFPYYLSGGLGSSGRSLFSTLELFDYLMGGCVRVAEMFPGRITFDGDLPPLYSDKRERFGTHRVVNWATGSADEVMEFIAEYPGPVCDHDVSHADASWLKRGLHDFSNQGRTSLTLRDLAAFMALPPSEYLPLLIQWESVGYVRLEGKLTYKNDPVCLEILTPPVEW